MFIVRASSHVDSLFHLTLATLEDHLQTAAGNIVKQVPVVRRAFPVKRLQADQALEDAFASDDDSPPQDNAADAAYAAGVVTPTGDAGLGVGTVEVHFKASTHETPHTQTNTKQNALPNTRGGIPCRWAYALTCCTTSCWQASEGHGFVREFAFTS